MPEQYSPMLLIRALTGVTYVVQVGGRRNALCEVQGFLVPLYLYDPKPLMTLVKNQYHCPAAIGELPPARVVALHAAFEDGFVGPNGSDDVAVLDHRGDSWGEGWLPVNTIYGDGHLIWS